MKILNTSFYKYHALGNDYLVIEPDGFFKPKPDLVRKICDRNIGVGSDGILYGPDKGKNNLRIFNPDGSEAEKSGNGLRIFAYHLFTRSLVNSKNFKIQLPNEEVDVEIIDINKGLIRINMGSASFDPKKVGLNSEEEYIKKEISTDLGQFECTCISVGNPHCVIFSDDFSINNISDIGPILETHELFKNKTNVQLVKLIDQHNIEIRIWERGAGYTQASGSSSCATAFVSNYLGFTKDKVNVHMPGGVLEIQIVDAKQIFMTGTVSPVFRGSLL